MENILYEMIFKRKSFHIFRGIQTISISELHDIEEKFKTFQPLLDDIETDIRIVPAKETTCSRGQEYCILLYSEKKDNYLQNIGYIGEQLDLYLTSLNIGSLWFGIGKTEEKSYHGLEFVIMIAIAKVEESKFRKNMFKSKRKPVEEIWNGKEIHNVTNFVRFAPSACNTQPWIVENKEESINVFRYKKPGKRGIMPADKVSYYNRIDIGIFLCFMDLCLNHENVSFNREIFLDNSDSEAEKILTAKYKIDWKNLV